MDGRRHRREPVVQRCARLPGKATGDHAGQVVGRPLDPAAQRQTLGCDAPGIQEAALDQSASGVGPLVLRPPRDIRSSSTGRPSDAAMRTSASHPSRPAAVSAATCPSPRCSRRQVHQYQRAATGSSGGPVARVAANSVRPASGTPSRSACNPGTRARAVRTTPGTTRASTWAAAWDLVAQVSAGEAMAHASGRARRARSGWKLKNDAVTGSGPTGP